MDLRVGQNGVQGASAKVASSSRDRSRSRSVGKTGARQSQKKKKKKVQYNSREIPTQLLRAKKALGASEVLVRAREQVAELMKQSATGDYDETQMRAALNHANRIVKCARVKVNHLKEEERKKRVDERKHSVKSAKYRIKKMELERKKRQHRLEEKAKIDEADMKYNRERNTGSNHRSVYDDLGVSLEMSDSARAYNEKKLLEKELRELEQEMQGEAMEMADMADMDLGGLEDSAVLSGADGGDIGMDIPEGAL